MANFTFGQVYGKGSAISKALEKAKVESAGLVKDRETFEKAQSAFADAREARQKTGLTILTDCGALSKESFVTVFLLPAVEKGAWPALDARGPLTPQAVALRLRKGESVSSWAKWALPTLQFLERALYKHLASLEPEAEKEKRRAKAARKKALKILGLTEEQLTAAPETAAPETAAPETAAPELLDCLRKIAETIDGGRETFGAEILLATVEGAVKAKIAALEEAAKEAAPVLVL